jgi:tRNA pseudouridine32 synthase/23S rRNA pseudouridine746 synthase
MRDGVSASCVALPQPSATANWHLLLDFLAERLKTVPRDDWHTRMQRGEVLSEMGQPLSPHTPYAALAAQQPQARVYYYRALQVEARIPFEAHVLFEDEHVLVADKPHFLPVLPSGRFVRETLLVRLKAQTGLEALSPIHRIDRETAGLVVFSKRAQDRHAYQALFVSQAVHKTYLAIAPWQAHLQHTLTEPLLHQSRIEPDTLFFRQQEVEGPPNSSTQLAMLKHWDTPNNKLALYQLQPRTGKTHQLRVHMNALGAPMVGDQLYPEVKHAAGVDDFTQPLQLLAYSIAFTDPVNGLARHFVSQNLLQHNPSA